jgi:hypothetical protein
VSARSYPASLAANSITGASERRPADSPPVADLALILVKPASRS